MEPELTLNEYQEQTGSTAIYPGQGGPLGLIYCALKLNGESGELAEHVGKAIRDDNFVTDPGQLGKVIRAVQGGLTEERGALIDKEIGDCLWYLARLAAERGTTLGSLARQNLVKLAARKQAGTLQGSGDNR